MNYDNIKKELDYVNSLSDKDACKEFNVDLKEEIVEMLEEELKALKPEEFDYTSEELSNEQIKLNKWLWK